MGGVLWFHIGYLCVRLSISLSYISLDRRQVHSKASVSVEFHIMRLTSVYSIIAGVILHCGVKKMGIVVLKKIKERSKG